MLARARAVSLTGYCEIARHVGLDPFAMLSRAGLHPSALNDPENWLPASRILRLLDDSARHSGRDDFSILLGECRTFGSLGPVSLLLRHERDLRSTIMAMIKYRSLLNELLQLDLHITGPTAILEWNLIPGLRSSHGINLVATVAYRVLIDGAEFHWQPECIHFRHRAPVNSASFARVIRCPIEFDSAFDGMSFSSKSLDFANRSADPELAAHASRLLDLLPAIRRHDTLEERARAMIPMLLANGRVDAQGLADLMGLTLRTLQRRLLDEGKPFRAVLSEVRRELAVRYLGDSDQSIGSIASLLGYSTQASFARWFVTEFGESPSQWRKVRKGRDRVFIEQPDLRVPAKSTDAQFHKTGTG